ncbi:hypothetical protein CV093_20620 [Oceanobacillus sp. 143]|nr:hypothetical protein CV093_20620 [Oceanobacillus sp. 143]
MEVIKRIVLYLIGIYVFIMFVNGFIDESKQLYSLVQQQRNEQVEQMVHGKVADRDLFGKVNYYAIFEDGADTNVIHKNRPRTYAEISRNEFEELNVGDKVEGSITGRAFSNEDIRSQIYVHLIMMVSPSSIRYFYSLSTDSYTGSWKVVRSSR